MLLVVDADNLLLLFPSIEEAHDYIEWQDVAHDEYAAVDETGRVYDFVLHGYDYDIRPTDLVDPALPMTFLRRFAEPHGITDLGKCLPLSSFDDWQRCLDQLQEEVSRQTRRRWPWRGRR